MHDFYLPTVLMRALPIIWKRTRSSSQSRVPGLTLLLFVFQSLSPTGKRNDVAMATSMTDSYTFCRFVEGGGTILMPSANAFARSSGCVSKYSVINERIKNVGKSQSCMVSKSPIMELQCGGSEYGGLSHRPY